MTFVQAVQVHRSFNIPMHASWSILATDAYPLSQIPYHLAYPTMTIPLHPLLFSINSPTG
jgi:hypothetical protein